MRHRLARAIARRCYALPGATPLVRAAARTLTRAPILSRTNRRRIYNFVSLDTAPSEDVVCRVTLPGQGSVHFRLNLRDNISRFIYYFGYDYYERGTVRLLDALLQRRRCVFDVGANVGYYTLLAARRLGWDGAVHAFEPEPRIFQNLAESVKRSGLTGVTLNRAALSDRDGWAELHRPRMPDPGDNWGVGSLVAGHTTQDSSVRVRTERFDSYCRRTGVERVDLVKIDVEGHELAVLEGMGNLLDAWRPDIVIEVLPEYEQGLEAFFHESPYRRFLITDGGLEERTRLTANARARDYYLTCDPATVLGAGH